MTINNRIPNNADKIADVITERFGVEAVSDDGAVLVKKASAKVRNEIVAVFGNQRIGDGVQEGGLWINGEEA